MRHSEYVKGIPEQMSYYIMALMVENPLEQKREIFMGMLRGDCYGSNISASATMDQCNEHVLENISTEQYEDGNFFLYGVFEIAVQGLYNLHDD